MRRALVLTCLLLAAACQEHKVAGPLVTEPTAGTTTTWTDGNVIHGTVTIPEGSTVRIADKAQLHADKGSKVLVLGTLLADNQVRIGGADWDGIHVGSGGSLTAHYLQLTGAGLATELGAKPVTLADSHIIGATNPFMIATGTSVSMSKVTVERVKGPSVVKGTLVADVLSYDKGGNTGIVQSGPASVMRLTDSVLEGNGKFEGDMLNTSNAGELTVSGSVLKDNHCAFHVVGVKKMTLTKLSIHDNAFGFMAYGSDPAETQRITDTDVFDNRDYGLYENPSTVQGRVLVDGGFWGRNGRDIVQITGKIVRTNPAASPTG